MDIGRNAMLDVVSLTKSYANSVTVGPLSFTVQQGEFFSLLGPSGCGKSTTLRCIAGFETPTSGQIFLGGERLDIKPAYSRELGLVFQSHALFPHLNVAGNVAFGLAIRKIHADEIRRRVEWALDLVGLSGLGNRMPSQISGGQQQRVALARSLVLKPPLLLLDEPLSSLDLKLRQQMRDELRALQRQLGQTTIFVTHDQTEALAMSDRIAVLSNGRIEQVGTPIEIYRRPASRFVAGFIGQCNILDGLIERREGSTARLRIGSGHFLMARLPDDATVKPGDSVWAVVRPEDVTIGGTGTSEGGSPFTGTVRDIEFLGEDTQVRIDVPGLPSLTAAFKTTREAASRIASPNVSVRIDVDDVFVLHR
ncbi:ABC transporter ATP-binding protein [Microvirga massiliensis]|uniref:ABC transporter ATP-binding protein n=1 Tax=Microvirga massiliensis TaxID=1033741 RepID=UPI00069A22D5|nr:ABC transporter ATP-binding protein [Microvirga massiliensis]